ncbi:MAG: IPT/TIG domain-containing protein [Myxococcota bacterium]|nr:IPT/TIG domain-containing protein [Myxococcota bacterium]
MIDQNNRSILSALAAPSTRVNGSRLNSLFFVALCLCVTAACSDESAVGPGGTGSTDATSGLDGNTDQSDGTDASTGADGNDSPGAATWVQPSGVARLVLLADDTANRTYQNGQIRWTGSFEWDRDTNLLQFATSWLPEEREWPGLYDDGPISEGGHEAEGQIANDGVFSTELWFNAVEETTFEYGALNEESNWIWTGPNGTLTVPAGTTDVLDAGRLTFPAFGTLDMRLTIDTSALSPEFATITPESDNVFVKGTMNSWSPVQLLDDGSAGDEVAGDGIFTYLHSTKLGPHDGLLATGQQVQFVFVFALKEQFVEDGIEYKFPVDAVLDGVRAYTGAGTTWLEETVVLSPASDGNVKNTSITVTSEGISDTACTSDGDCPSGYSCLSGACTVNGDGCSSDNDCNAGFECTENLCTPKAPECSDSEPCLAGDICVSGVCITPECSVDGDCQDGFVCVSGTCAIDLSGDGPQISLVYPAAGSIAGGTAVTVSGVGFADGATVSFGGVAATSVEYVSGGTLTCVTPAGPTGSVTVRVENLDGQYGVFVGGFTYTENPAPVITEIAPSSGKLQGGEQVTITGSGFQVGASVQFGLYSANSVAVAPGGTSLTCNTPAVAAPGSVDVTITNPDGQSTTESSGFKFELGAPAFAVLEPPFDVSAMIGFSTATVSARVYHPSITEPDGPGEQLIAELGYGPENTEPSDGWTWNEASYVGQGGAFGNDDVWEGTLSVSAAGVYDWAFRFSFDGIDWTYADRDSAVADYQVAEAGTLVAEALPPGLAVAQVTPTYASTLGNTSFTIVGQNFDTVTDVQVGGVAAEFSIVDAGTITAVAPGGAAGPTEVTVTNGNDTASIAFQYAELITTVTDGTLGEWSQSLALADDTSNAGWDLNDLNVLYIGFDADGLSIGVDGMAEASNAMVVYLDFDYGSGSGEIPSTLQDSAGALDSAISSSAVSVYDSGFGAEWACGGFGSVAVDGFSDDSGCRRLDDPTNFAWFASTIAWGADGMEIRVPWDILALSPSPTGRTLGAFVRIINEDGGLVSPEGLPSSQAGDGSVDTVVTTWIP